MAKQAHADILLGPSPACLSSCFRTGVRQPCLHCHPCWDSSAGLSASQEMLLRIMTTYHWGIRAGEVLVPQVTPQLEDCFHFGGNKGASSVWVVGAYPALSWRYSRHVQDICLRPGKSWQLNPVQGFYRWFWQFCISLWFLISSHLRCCQNLTIWNEVIQSRCLPQAELFQIGWEGEFHLELFVVAKAQAEGEVLY